jgi:hypothetical protein
MTNYGYGFGYGSHDVTNVRTHLVPGQAPRASPQEDSAPEKKDSIPAIPATTSNSVWYCEACDLELDSQQALKSHRKSHVKCTECAFEGAPKIVKAHFQGCHGKFSGSGFKTVTVAIPGCRVQRFRICVGNRPEDIQRWIEERKKRFPRQNPPNPTELDSKPETTKETAGLDSLLAGYGSSESEDEAKTEKEIEPTVAETQQGLLANEKCTAEGPPADDKNPKRLSRPCRYFMRKGSCLNGDSCRFSHELPVQRFTPEKNAKRQKRGGHSTSETLLRKLLANDMERESALTMQLLEFIVDRNFFENPSET